MMMVCSRCEQPWSRGCECIDGRAVLSPPTRQTHDEQGRTTDRDIIARLNETIGAMDARMAEREKTIADLRKVIEQVGSEEHRAKRALRGALETLALAEAALEEWSHHSCVLVPEAMGKRTREALAALRALREGR